MAGTEADIKEGAEVVSTDGVNTPAEERTDEMDAAELAVTPVVAAVVEGACDEELLEDTDPGDAGAAWGAAVTIEDEARRPKARVIFVFPSSIFSKVR